MDETQKAVMRTKFYEVLMAEEVDNAFKAEYLADFVEKLIDIKSGVYCDGN